MSHQAQPVRTGDVYPQTSAKREACHERDTIIEHGQERGDDLHVKETDLPATGRRMVTASAGGQVMAQFTVPVPSRRNDDDVAAEATDDAVTLGEAIQAAAQTSAGDRPVGRADAAAAQAAEMRATGLPGNVPGGLAAAAQRAAETNARREAAEDEKVTLRDVVVSGGGDNAAVGLSGNNNKVATREDARMVAAAAARNVGKGKGKGKGSGGAGGGGIAEAVVAAADMNEGRMV